MRCRRGCGENERSAGGRHEDAKERGDGFAATGQTQTQHWRASRQWHKVTEPAEAFVPAPVMFGDARVWHCSVWADTLLLPFHVRDFGKH